MSWIRCMTFWCDECEVEQTYVGGGNFPAELATREGWRVFLGDYAGHDTCPECSEKLDSA